MPFMHGERADAAQASLVQHLCALGEVHLFDERMPSRWATSGMDTAWIMLSLVGLSATAAAP